MISDDARLCFVKGPRAWFTTCCPFEKQWGDDWNDAPYEHNAGTPYEWAERRGVPEYEVDFVFYDSDLETPDEVHINSPWSVEQINAGAVAWLASPSYDEKKTVIPAGTTYKEFRRLIQECGGRVFVSWEDPTDG